MPCRYPPFSLENLYLPNQLSLDACKYAYDIFSFCKLFYFSCPASGKRPSSPCSCIQVLIPIQVDHAQVTGRETIPTNKPLLQVNIEQMAVMEGNSACIRYGAQGTGGVIIINTKAQTGMDDSGIIKTYDNRSLADSLVRVVSSADHQ